MSGNGQVDVVRNGDDREQREIGQVQHAPIIATAMPIHRWRNNDFIEVLDGLKPGERVVTSTYSGLIDKDQLSFDTDQ